MNKRNIEFAKRRETERKNVAKRMIHGQRAYSNICNKMRDENK